MDLLKDGDVEKANFIRFIMTTFDRATIEKCLGGLGPDVAKRIVERKLDTPDRQEKKVEQLFKASKEGKDNEVFVPSEEKNVTTPIAKTKEGEYLCFAYDFIEKAWVSKSGSTLLLDTYSNIRKMIPDKTLPKGMHKAIQDEDAQLTQDDLKDAMKPYIDLLNQPGTIISTSMCSWAAGMGAASTETSLNPYKAAVEILQEMGGTGDGTGDGTGATRAAQMTISQEFKNSVIAPLLCDHEENSLVYAQYFEVIRTSSPPEGWLLSDVQTEKRGDNMIYKFWSLEADCKAFARKDKEECVTIHSLRQTLDKASTKKLGTLKIDLTKLAEKVGDLLRVEDNRFACYAVGGAWSPDIQGKGLEVVIRGTGAFGRRRRGSSKYERLQRVAANKNIYLTTARQTRFGTKFLGYKFGSVNGQHKWNTNGKWMSQQDILGTSFGSGCTDDKGFTNFYKLDNLYPKMENGDLPLINMHPLQFGYVKTHLTKRSRKNLKLAGFGAKKRTSFGRSATLKAVGFGKKKKIVKKRTSFGRSATLKAVGFGKKKRTMKKKA